MKPVTNSGWARLPRCRKEDLRTDLNLMGKQYFLRYVSHVLILGVILFGSAISIAAQDIQPNAQTLRVDVNLVLLNVAVTDHKGGYVTRLRPTAFAIYEDNIPQKHSPLLDSTRPQAPTH